MRLIKAVIKKQQSFPLVRIRRFLVIFVISIVMILSMFRNEYEVVYFFLDPSSWSQSGLF